VRSASRASSALLVLLVVCVALGYGRVLDAPFVFDDVRNVAENPALVASEPGLEGLRRAAFESPTLRPTAYLSFAANAWSGAGPRGYRLVNLGLHLLNGWLVFALATLLYRRGAALAGVPPALTPPRVQLACAALAALWFVAHPLQTQSVTYIVQRMTSLATALGLAALWLWLRSDGLDARRRPLAQVGALALFVLACGAKEIALVFPASLWLVQATFRHDFDLRWMLRTAVPGIAVGLAALALVLLRTNALGDYAAQPFSLGERLLSAPRVLWLYASWVVWPLPSRLNLLHDVVASRSLLDPPTTWLAAVALAALVGVAMWGARRARFATFAVLWFGLHLALETSIPPLALAFEHRLYLPLVGVAIAVPPLLLRVTGGRVTPALGIGGVLCAVLLSATVVRNEVWRSPVALWTDTARKSPNHAIALDELGLALAKAGRLAEARDVLTRATTLVPRRAEVFAHLGFVEGLRGEPERKRVWLERAIEIDPSYPRAHHALGLSSDMRSPRRWREPGASPRPVTNGRP
jgi:tetratricopeptide (TPR) repeat protein